MQEGLARVAPFDHSISVVTQNLHCHPSELVLILHHQQCLRTSQRGGCVLRFGGSRLSPIRTRKGNRKRRSRAWLAVNPKRSLALLDNAICRCQSQSSSLPDRLRREEWFI